MKLAFAWLSVRPLILGCLLSVLSAACAAERQKSDDGLGGADGNDHDDSMPAVPVVREDGGAAGPNDVSPKITSDALATSDEMILRYQSHQKLGSDFAQTVDSPLWSTTKQAFYVRGGETTFLLSGSGAFDDIGIAQVRALTEQGEFIAARRVGNNDMGVIFKQRRAEDPPVDLSGEVAWPNDLVTSRKGHIYFTQRKGVADAPQQQDGLGLVHHVDLEMRDHKHEGVPNPNGIGLSPDESWLFISGSSYDKVSDGGLWRLKVGNDGALGTPSRIAHVERPDGLCVDSLGNVHVTSVTKRQILIFSPEGQPRGEVVNLPRSMTNCALGGSNGQTLYVTAQKSVYRLMRAP